MTDSNLFETNSTDTSVLSLLRARVHTVTAALIQRAGEIQLNMLQYLWRLLGWGDATAVPADNENSNQILTEHEDASVTETTRSCDGGVAENPKDSAQNVTEDSGAGLNRQLESLGLNSDGRGAEERESEEITSIHQSSLDEVDDDCFIESPAAEERTESQTRGLASPMRVRLFSGKSHSIAVSPDDSVRRVKEDIGREVNQNPDTLQLVYDGSVLEDKKILKDCEIETEKPLTLIRSSLLINKQTEFPLFRVKIRFNGRDHEMDVNPRHCVSQVKQEICEEMGKEAKKMLLLFEAPQTTNCSSGDPCPNSDVIVLEERKKIEEYDIKQGSVIRLLRKTDWETK